MFPESIGESGMELNEFIGHAEAVFPDATLEQLHSLSHSFDVDQDQRLNISEYRRFHDDFWRPLSAQTPALIIIDFQNDFISGSLPIGKGSAGEDPEEAIPIINGLLRDCGDSFRTIVYSLDWHPADHISFVDNVHRRRLVGTQPAEPKVFDKVQFEGSRMEQILWPRHCVQNTWGAELHRDLLQIPNSIHIYKGVQSDIDSNSVFFDNERRHETELRSLLSSEKVNSVYLCGLATDVCVAASARDAVRLGLRVVIVEDCVKGVDRDGIEKAKENLRRSSCAFFNKDRIPQLLCGKIIPWVWAQVQMEKSQI